jgi:hypothetical protein
LEKIQYDKYTWNICGDLKVIALVLGLQLGYTKFCCFLCDWDSRDRKSHYTRKNWPKRDFLTPGNKNFRRPPLIKPENVYLPPLHIELGLMKNFVKGIDQYGAGFSYLKETIPRISDAKIKEGIFVGPKIRELMQDAKFEEQLTQVENIAWSSFKNVTKHFLGNI